MKKTLPVGPIMIDISGTMLSPYDIEKITHPNTGGVILFTRNYAEPRQVAELCKQIKAARNGPILIAVDQEGGRVQRFQNGFTRLPPVAAFTENPELSEEAGWLMAAELLVLGVDFSFAPVLDIDCGVSQIIANRSFSPDPELTCQLASSFTKGMRSAGMAATGKHFPGHGAVALDSHLTLPIDKRDLDTINSKDILPFKQLINEGLEGIMPAHVVYPAIDELPAGFSAIWINEILRKQLSFNGAVFSDDLSMEGAACVGDFDERAKLARQAGCDMILVCNNESAAEQVLESTPIEHNAIRDQRLLAMLGKSSLTAQELKQSSRWKTASQQLTQLSSAYA
ncbi:beta-N-acetylhexosaminidase [Bathymodiolus japonicus methanotrophic gill symbiont]|uniref:beta-N-acetylhexosaminidase n=1 Tax=Bathymodiolus japonicus methanotrophic gill symbiont TaxID=113269 RepID=UPI001B4695DA|nr:beta-N-acetylhexosaminidase [Bathymodiolus japonicus methanotrophic gill symbiont]GFO71430.1 beta-N-acetylhexosaminidase [Bathymodiolus japonicus methanotrophic gill symbiont]